MIQLYGYWRSTAAYRVRIALNIKQASYTQHSVHLVKQGGEQYQPAYQLINPQGLVPTLVDGDIHIGQSLAIMEYLDEKYSNNPLLPTDYVEKAKVRQLCYVIACDLHPLNNLRVLKYLSNELNIDDESKTKWYHHWLKVGFDAFQGLLDDNKKDGPYCFGRELTMADACLIPQVYNASRFGFSMEAYPSLMKINQHCLALERFSDAIPENQPDAEN